MAQPPHDAVHDSSTAPRAEPARADLAGRRLHFVGIGGSGMSGLARMAQARGARCTGSDRSEGERIAQLRDAGIDVVLEQTARAVPESADELVISAAIKEDHPEVVEARRRGLAVTKYAAMLGRLMAGQLGVAIAGTHGKSTTTSLLAHVLIQCGLDPSFILGANCEQIGGGWRVGGGRAETGGHAPAEQEVEVARDRGVQASGDHPIPGVLDPASPPTADPLRPSAPPNALLLAEACEYDRSFHNLRPTLGLILNVEADHLDLYASIEEIVEAFAVFARLIPARSAGGLLLINHEMAHRLAITAGLECEAQSIGFAPQADWVVQPADGRVRLVRDGQTLTSWVPPMPGEHMAYNAAAAAVTAHRLGADWPGIVAAIESFRGLDRRMQVVGRAPLADQSAEASTDQPADEAALPLVIDDYGHHPTEIDTTLRALRRHYRPARLICVFQPHQHSRTRFLMPQFATSFAEADAVIVPDIFFVRDSQQEREAVTAADLVRQIQRHGGDARHIPELDAIADHVRGLVRRGDLIVTMGAGDVWKVSRALVER